MTSPIRYGFVMLVVVAALLVAGGVAASIARVPRNNDISNMADALKFLQDLDSYYGDRARVRFGKRNVLSELYQNSMAETAGMNRAGESSNADEPF